MTFNENAPDLECENINKNWKRCTVPKSHFKGLENGYYFTKHQNHLNGKSISYEAPPVEVILSSSDPNSNSNPNSNDGSNSSTTLIIVLSVVGGIILILLILLLIIHFKKKNSSSNIDTQNANDIGLLNK